MTRRFALLLLPALVSMAGPKKTVATARGENEDLVVTVTLHIDPAEIKEFLGNDLGGHFIVADVKAEPKYGKEVAIDRDDFVLRTDKDGERAKPFVASQIAGQGTMVITQTNEPAGSPGMVGTIGGPVIMGGGGGGFGTGSAVPGNSKATMKNDEKENPVKKTLDARILRDGKTEQPVTGLLYFPMEKQKLKDLELLYGDKENRISIRFRQ